MHFTHDNFDSEKCILYFHGGGYVAGSPETHQNMLLSLSHLSSIHGETINEIITKIIMRKGKYQKKITLFNKKGREIRIPINEFLDLVNKAVKKIKKVIMIKINFLAFSLFFISNKNATDNGQIANNHVPA